jgi:hypothetical protein
VDSDLANAGLVFKSSHESSHSRSPLQQPRKILQTGPSRGYSSSRRGYEIHSVGRVNDKRATTSSSSFLMNGGRGAFYDAKREGEIVAELLNSDSRFRVDQVEASESESARQMSSGGRGITKVDTDGSTGNGLVTGWVNYNPECGKSSRWMGRGGGSQRGA